MADRKDNPDAVPSAVPKDKAVEAGPDVSNADLNLLEYSRDASNAEYVEVRPDDIEPSAGPQVAQVLGKPKGE